VTNLINCCSEQNVDLPTGPWALAVLNYTERAFGDVYDSGFSVYIDGVLVLDGTGAEYGTWTVQQDITEYSALLSGVINLTLRVGAAVINGYFESNLTLLLYPVPPGAEPPIEPTEFIPLWSPYIQNNIFQSDPTVYQQVNVPKDVVNATLELWARGAGPDEFWYSELPAYRAITVASDGTALATEYPFPFVQTGGIDLFLWRPVTAVGTIDQRPLVFDLTGALPLIEGTHNLTATIAGISNSNWHLDGTLVLYTDPRISGATLQSYYANETVTPDRTVGDLTFQSANATYIASNEIAGPGGVTNVTSVVRESFSSNTTVTENGEWENLSQNARVVGSTELSGPAGTSYFNHTFDAPFSVDLGSVFVESSTTNGGYPIFGNFTSSFLRGYQAWNESFSRVGPGAGNATISTLSDELTGANGTFTGEEELTDPNAAQLLGISSISSYCPRKFLSTEFIDGASGSYLHVVVGSGVNPSDPNGAVPVVTDSVNATMGVAVTANLSTAEVGASVTLRVYAPGARGGLTVDWSGLPSGCSAADVVVLVCTPTAVGTATVTVTVHDGTGDSATGSLGNLVVTTGPAAAVLPSNSTIDLGGSVTLNATVTGGRGPYTCLWWVGGALASPAEPCDRPFMETPTHLGTYYVNVTVVDGEGVMGHSARVGIDVVQPVSITISGKNEIGSVISAVVGSMVTLSADLSGGIGPYQVSWFIDDSPAATGLELNVTVGAAGTSESVFALVNDSGAGSNLSGTLTVQSISGSPGGSSGSSGSSSLSTETLTFIVMGVGVVAAAVLLILLWPTRKVPNRGRREPAGQGPSEQNH
jgi:hypothetical protein